MSKIIITSASSYSCFNNGRLCNNDLTSIKLLKKIDQPRLSFKFITKYENLRYVIIFSPYIGVTSIHELTKCRLMSSSFQPQASSSSSSSSPSPTPSPSPSSSSPWKKWVWGFLLTVILPAAGHKGGLLLTLKGKIDEAVKMVEHVTEVVEEIAEEAEKIVEEVEEKLPGDSKIKEALESFDNLAKLAIKEAKKAEDIIHKVKDVEEEIEGVLGKHEDKK